VIKGLVKYSKGQVLPLYLGIVATLLGATAICTDVAVMYMNSIQVQKAADTAAIAGANYLVGLTFSGTATACTGQSDDAKKAACTYAVNNGITTDGLTITEPTSSTIQVTAQRTNLPYYFGKVIGLSTYSVSATAVGQAAQPVGTVKNGLFPVGLQCTAPCDLSNLDPGQAVSFGAKFVGGLAPGNWQFLDVSGGHGGGDSLLAAAIASGASTTFTIGDSIISEPGNKGKSGPVKSALASRLGRCASIADPCANGGNPKDIPGGDACLVIVPAVDYHGCTGSCGITIEGFALIYLEQSSSSTHIDGCFVQAVAADTITSTTAPNLGAVMPPSIIK
jgi:hypothetical protein